MSNEVKKNRPTDIAPNILYIRSPRLGLQQFTFNSWRLPVTLLLVVLTSIIAHPVAAKNPTNENPADYVKVFKAKREMVLYRHGEPIKRYHVSLGDNPIGHKQQQGDEKTPEGIYTIDFRNPKSSYHLSLHINYPNVEDKRKAKQRGVHPGGDIFIHGLPNGMGAMAKLFLNRDWTDGCIAVNNQEIEEIWRLVRDGTRIEILP